MARQLQLTPPHMGQTLELSSLHKTQPQSSPATAQHAQKIQDKNGPAPTHPNIAITQYKKSHKDR